MVWKSATLALLGPFGTMTFQRGFPPANTDIQVRARMRGYRPDELVGGVQQTEREVIAYADDVTFDPPLKVGDRVFDPDDNNRLYTIQAVDGATGRTDEGLAFYRLRVK